MRVEPGLEPLPGLRSFELRGTLGSCQLGIGCQECPERATC